MNQEISDFIQCKRIAVVGVSRDPNKFGSRMFIELKARGYHVFAVNPAMNIFNEDPCYPDLAALKEKVEGVVVNVPPERAIGVLKEAAQNGIKNIWLQQGAESPEVLETARELSLNPVVKKCILMYAPPITSFHKFHRFFAKLFGQL
jgi:predicted CoA-binding protein